MICIVCASLGHAHAAQKPNDNQNSSGLLLPVATAYDTAGNLFFADARRNQIFELTLAGTWSVVAGTGEQGFAGDSGAATSAMLNGPRGLAVAADGTLYIADTGNQRVRAVSQGTISTVAGSGVRGFSGDGAVLQVALRDPSGLAVDTSGNLLICDTGNQRVRRVSGGQLATIAGNGVQGFSGDGGAATAAELDTPLGVAVNSSGTVLIADTHNNRVRAVAADGTITTLAGTGVKGFGGDGGQASLAVLDQPYGVAFSGDGSVLIADSGNQRVRAVSTAGVIRTVAGTGVQGVAADATAGAVAALDTPRSVSVQPLGAVAFAEAHNNLVRELASDNALYTLALLAAPRTSSVSLSAASNVVYGQGAATVHVTGSAATPQGTVALLDNGSSVGLTRLASGSTSFGLGMLSAGSHTLTVSYSGDGLNGSASSAASSLIVAPAPAVANANAATAVYGAAVPALSGTLSGVLPQDSANVHAVFSTTAGPLAPVGSYPISAALSGQGSANYSLTTAAGSGALVITQAASNTTLAPTSQTYAGLPLLLAASVASTTSGAPGGVVDFLDGTGVIGSSPLTNGVASSSVLFVSGGAHTFSARYRGDSNFLASQSALTNLTAAAMPDFGLEIPTSSQSVQGGSVTVFAVGVSPQGGPFTGAVSMSVSGLPQGATATFSPVSVVPGASAASVNLSIQTVARTGWLPFSGPLQMATAFGVLTLFWWMPRGATRRRRLRALSCIFLCGTMAAAGCGTRTTGSAAPQGQSYTLTIRGTGTNLAGAAVSHTATAMLTVF